jgi:hypothetical protein
MAVSARDVLSDNVARIVGELTVLDTPAVRQSTRAALFMATEIIECAGDVLYEAGTMSAEDQRAYLRAMRRLAAALDGERRND